jgi:hypothetical protein
VKRFIALAGSLALVVGFATPAANATNYSVVQKTLSSFSSAATSLTAAQRAEVRRVVEQNPTAEKFICTGIRFESAPMAENITVRKRAKAACDYAKTLNPKLSTFFQNKPTKARSYAGKVLLTVKNPVQRSAASPSSVELCKVPDGRPASLQGYPRGATVDGKQVRGSIGFPLTVGRFPIMGEANIIAVMVSFTDTEEFVDKPVDFLGPQTKKITNWSKYWSQGKFQYNFQIIENWIRLPIKSSEASSNDEVLAKMILDQFPQGIDYESVDGTFIYWAPGINAANHDFGIRVGSNENPFVVGEKRPGLVWAPSQWHFEDSGQDGRLSYEIKREYTWSYWIHELLHEQGLNLHAPGNGWATGLGQNQYPKPDGASTAMPYSAALPAWELFLMGWLDDSQVHCITDKDLGSTQEAVLTPLEIKGGDRKAIVIQAGSSDEILVVESRRPTGYTEDWSKKASGLLVYRANPNIESQDDHSANDCGNNPKHTKWSYYLFPDNEKANPDTWCRSYEIAIVNRGESVTYNGVQITLSSSTAAVDVVQIKRAPRSLVRRASETNTVPSALTVSVSAEADLWIREQEQNNHCYCCGCKPGGN